MQLIDLTSQCFGRLTVLARGKTSSNRQIRWLCQCQCGSPVKEILGILLKSGNTQSCGCLRSENVTLLKTVHGLRNSAEYRIWRHMRTRCENVKAPAYKYYGERGIKICVSWMQFANFYADMGARPSSQHSIDRIDVDKNYEPLNCRWATMTEQQRNRRNNRRFFYQGIEATLAELCEIHGLKYSTVHRRLTVGANIDTAMTKGRLQKNNA